MSPLLQSSVNHVLVSDLPPSDASQLPAASSSEWSMFDKARSRNPDRPVALSGIKREIIRTVAQYAIHRKQDMSPEEIEYFFSPEVPAWYDTSGMVTAYRNLVEHPHSPVSYDRKVNLHNTLTTFPITEWWNMHLPHCNTCSAHLAKEGGVVAAALSRNSDNECHFADIMSWLSGGWRLPLSSWPDRNEAPNHASLLWSPSSVVPEIVRMTEWRAIVPGKPHLVHPMMVVIRDGELNDQLRIMEAIGQPCPRTSKEDIEYINDYIDSLDELEMEIPDHLGRLKKVKVRLCLNMSLFLNDYLYHWAFQYAYILDGVSILEPRVHLGKLDLDRYFNQLPLHPDDYPLLGCYIPKHLHPDPTQISGDGRYYISPFAHFGGASFPAYGNTIMSGVSTILWSHGIPNVFMTDDLLITGRSYAECEANLKKAIAILEKLGLKLQVAKVTWPSQVMPFLGFLIDTVNQRLSIPQDKLNNYIRFIRQLLLDNDGGHLTVGNLESLIGKLNHVAEVMVHGRLRIKALRRCIPGGGHYRPPHNKRIELSSKAKDDIKWWLDLFSQAEHNPLWVPYWHGQPPLYCKVYSDASGDKGFGLVLGSKVYQGAWSPEALPKSSGFKELIPILLALHLLPEEAAGSLVAVQTDNLSNVYNINKGSCQSDELVPILSEIFELAVAKGVYLVADWMPREFNEYCDFISKVMWSLD